MNNIFLNYWSDLCMQIKPIQSAFHAIKYYHIPLPSFYQEEAAYADIEYVEKFQYMDLSLRN